MFPTETPTSRRLRVAGMAFSSPTPAAGLAAEVVDVGAGDEAGFAAAAAGGAGGAGVKGRWALVHSEPMKSIDDLFKEYLVTPGILARARRAGAAGILWMSTRSGKLLYRHNLALDGSLAPLPGAVVEREGAQRIARLLAAGETVTVRLTLASEAPAAARAENAVAEIRGREHPEEVVILGAHLDSWDLGRGALDNGCNAALVIDVARQAMALARAGMRPRRTLRFVLYTGEEQGTFGSWGEVANHRGELDRVKAQIVFDEGTGRTTGFSLGGRADLRPSVEAALAPAAGLGPFVHTVDAFVGTDNYDYLVEGVPTLVANQDAAPYLPDYHAESDTFDKADLRELKANAAIAGILAWNLADAAGPLPPRQTPRRGRGAPQGDRPRRADEDVRPVGGLRAGRPRPAAVSARYSKMSASGTARPGRSGVVSVADGGSGRSRSPRRRRISTVRVSDRRASTRRRRASRRGGA